MPLNPQPTSESTSLKRRFGLRIESNSLQLAIATPDLGGRWKLSFDQVERSIDENWLTETGAHDLERAVDELVQRYQMHRHQVAVTLDGDYCVTRVSMGSTEEVDRELESLADRIPRYLQLGPGEKVTGTARTKTDDGSEHVVTGVVNRSVIQIIYDTVRAADLDVTWVEPSLVSISRLVGRDPRFADIPVLIADGLGKVWDVGIAFGGRLLLDYRPAAGRGNRGFCEALEAHFTRLQRFCHRYRRIASGELNELLVCGEPEKTSEVIEIFHANQTFHPRLLESPQLGELYRLEANENLSEYVPAVASVYPLLQDTSTEEVPDLLISVLRAADAPLWRRLTYQCWPVAVAALSILVSYGLIAVQHGRHVGAGLDREALRSEIVATQVKFAEISRRQEWLRHLEGVQQQTTEADWHQIFLWVKKTLPPSIRLRDFRVESGTTISLDGASQDETLIYELVNSLRKIPGVIQVALKGTTPESNRQTTQFMVRLTMQGGDPGATSASLIQASNESRFQ